MRLLLPAIILGLLAGTAITYGDEGTAHVVQKFDNSDTNVATALFTVQDKWEVLWTSPRPINITLISSDGTVITGVHGAVKGSFYQPKGGTYYLQVNSDHPELKVPWHLIVAEVASGTSLNGMDVDPAFSNPGDPNYAPLASVLPPASVSPAGSVVQTTPMGPPTDPNATANPFGQISPPPPKVVISITPLGPSSIPTAPPTTPPTPAPVTNPATDPSRAVVLIAGDHAKGTGFLIKTPDGPAVVTNIHLMVNNPNLKITTTSGTPVTMLSMKGASDRDLALLAIQDAHYSYLDMATDLNPTVQPGDEILAPVNSPNGDVVALNRGGTVKGLGPVRIEIDNPVNSGNSGGPMILAKSGKVVGVMTESWKTAALNLSHGSFAQRHQDSGSMCYFGLRLDTVSAWIPIDSRRFEIEMVFLHQFHEQTRRLDAYVNCTDKNRFDNLINGDSNNDRNPSNIYLSDDKIMQADADYVQHTGGADVTQTIDALKNLLFAVQGLADNNMDQIQNMNNFTSFNRERAHDELDYRKALKAELDSIGTKLEQLGSAPRMNE